MMNDQRNAIAVSLSFLADDMDQIARRMRQVTTDAQWKLHADEMTNAARMCRDWADSIGEEMLQALQEPAAPVARVAVEADVSPRSGLYLCSRTSAPGDKPCDEAFPVVVTSTDARTGQIPGWYDQGTNHRVEGGVLRRDMGTVEKWAVEIPDVMAFVDKYGACVIARDGDGFGTIEIYDDYRE